MAHDNEQRKRCWIRGKKIDIYALLDIRNKVVVSSTVKLDGNRNL